MTKEIAGAKPEKREIHETARFGSGCAVWHFAVVLQDVVVGDYVSLGSHCEIGRGSVIGDRARIGKGVFLPPKSQIGAEVFIGPGVTFTDDKHPRVSLASGHYTAEPPIVEDFASIGAGAVICPGVRIGRRARIGAGAVVTRDVPAESHVRGEPARTRTLSLASAQKWA
jgi:UDP-2-acetamido-3-amino-2,3-dideoxy-glucuronate N-acetyltransferase